MALIHKKDGRRIIPKWHSFKLASLNGELQPFLRNKTPLIFDSKSFLLEQKKDWEGAKNISRAGDILSSASVFGVASEFKNVAEYVINNNTNINSPLYKLASKLVGIENVQENLIDIQNLSITDKLSNQKYFHEIRKIKSYLKLEPKNPIGWVELGRLYSLVNLVSKAEKCITNALQLDKDNRFIVRSASRFYYHFSNEDDKALYTIKKSEYSKSDPWLISADIAYSTILKRHSKLTKVGTDYLGNKNIDFRTTSELSSAIGTIAYIKGKLQDSRKYFSQSIVSPNDNSLAQYASFAKSANMQILDLTKFSSITTDVEVKSQNLYNEEKFLESYNNAIVWQNEEPYSIRPLKHAAYIASVFLDNKKNAIELNRKALVLDPKDHGSINNLIYELALDDQIDEAFALFSKIGEFEFKNLDNISKITLRATGGLVHFRKGDIELGRHLYKEALSIANKENSFLYALGLANYAREELRVEKNSEKIHSLMELVKKTCKDRVEPDIKQFYKKAMDEYEKYNKNFYL